MKKILSFFLFILMGLCYSQEKLPQGYGGLKLGMSVEEAKKALLDNMDFGYRGDRDVSFLPGENRLLIETDGEMKVGASFLERCWFQFYEDKLYIITINISQERMDHYTVFDKLTKKYGKPLNVTPTKTTWKNDDVTMTLERPLTIKYINNKTFESLKESKIAKSGSEMTSEMFLEGL